jgi:glutathione synthase/RimK-type ligase-like ATP-grasp enzyme
MHSGVFIVSTKVDLATDAVVQRLGTRGVPFYRLNTEDFPFEDTLAYAPSEAGTNEQWLVCNGTSVPSPSSIWYRRIRTPDTPTGMEEGVATFCRQETRAAMIGAVMGRQGRWMSHPAAVWSAEFKPFQLQVAARLGIPIPRTLVTNDPVRIRAMFHAVGDLIIKPTRSGHFVRDDIDYAIYTSRLLAEHLQDLESARWSPSIYQQRIPKKYDIRATIVGDRCFVAAIDSPSDPAAQTDWRQTTNAALPHYRHELPTNLTEQLLRLMKVLNLAFGAIDLVQSPSGEYVFLEVNPSGQWLWLDDMLELGISDSVTDWLAAEALP